MVSAVTWAVGAESWDAADGAGHGALLSSASRRHPDWGRLFVLKPLNSSVSGADVLFGITPIGTPLVQAQVSTGDGACFH